MAQVCLTRTHPFTPAAHLGGAIFGLVSHASVSIHATFSYTSFHSSTGCTALNGGRVKSSGPRVVGAVKPGQRQRLAPSVCASELAEAGSLCIVDYPPLRLQYTHYLLCWLLALGQRWLGQRSQAASLLLMTFNATLPQCRLKCSGASGRRPSILGPHLRHSATSVKHGQPHSIRITNEYIEADPLAS